MAKLSTGKFVLRYRAKMSTGRFVSHVGSSSCSVIAINSLLQAFNFVIN